MILLMSPRTRTQMILDKVVALAGNEHMSVVATSESSLYFFSKCGRRLLPALVLSAQVLCAYLYATHIRHTHKALYLYATQKTYA